MPSASLPLGRVSAYGGYNYYAQAGLGSGTFQSLSTGGGWRAALLGTVATGALWLMAPRPARAAPDGCTVVGTTATCTGDQSGGIRSGADFNATTVDTLNVNSLTTDITPAAGTSGIYFGRSGIGDTITINSDLTPHSISVTGAADGITAIAPGDITVTHTGDITSAGHNGISLGSGYGKATITSTGTISAYAAGISAEGLGDVTVSHTGDITSTNGYGITAVSRGGAVSITSSGNIRADQHAIYAYGQDDVTVSHTGNIASTNVYGIVASSTNGAVTVTSSGTISAHADGIYATGQGNITVSHTGDIRSTNGYGIYAVSNSGAVSVTDSGKISAHDDGIRATGQSDLTVSHTGDITSTNSYGIVAGSTNGAVSVTNNGTISAHGHGIYASGAGDVTVSQAGNLTSTNGYGIVAGSTSGAVSVTSSGTISAQHSGIYANGGGDVTVSHTGDIVSRYGDGIFANGAGNVAITHTGDIDAGAGHGIYAVSTGTVTIVNIGNITAHCCGINAQAFGDITITQTGDINAEVNGIYARSVGGRVSVAVNGGKVNGGYAGIYFSGGGSSVVTPNLVTIGAGTTITGGTWAIKGAAGFNGVYNYGAVTGDVDIGAAFSGFVNEPGGLFNSGGTVIAGALVNDGTLAPGGIGAARTTALTGSFIQNAGGTFAVDVNLAGAAADRLNVSGTANLAGTVAPHLMSLGAAPQTFTIVSAAGSTTDNGLTVQDSAVVDYKLLFPNATDVELKIASVNFAPSGLTPNQQAVGQNLQQSFLAGGGDLSNLLLALANEGLDSFAADLSHLSPEPYVAQVQASLWSGFDFANSLFSCPVPSNGTASLFGEESCSWLRPNGRVASHGSSDGFLGFTERAAGLAGGMQNALAPDWYLDIGFGYERSDIDADSSEANGNVFHGGAALKYIRDRWLIAGSVSGAFARYDTSRFGLPTGGTATANADTASLDLRLRLAYAFGSSAFYVKPMVDFDVVGLWRDAIDESGAGALDLHVQRENDWVASTAPAAEFGTEWRHGHFTWRPYVRAGVRFLSQDDFSVTASFAGAPAGVPAFTVTSPIDQTLAEFSAGFNVWQDKRLSLEVSYDGRFGAHDSENGGAVKLRAAF